MNKSTGVTIHSCFHDRNFTSALLNNHLTLHYLWYQKNADPTPETSRPYEEKMSL